jgi:hypothetical protein
MANHMPNPIKSGFCFYWEPYYGIYRVRIFWKKLKNKLIKQSNVRNQFQYIVRIYPDDSTITWKNLLNCPHPLHPPSIDHIYIYIYIYIYTIELLLLVPSNLIILFNSIGAYILITYGDLN